MSVYVIAPKTRLINTRSIKFLPWKDSSQIDQRIRKANGNAGGRNRRIRHLIYAEWGMATQTSAGREMKRVAALFSLAFLRHAATYFTFAIAETRELRQSIILEKFIHARTCSFRRSRASLSFALVTMTQLFPLHSFRKLPRLPKTTSFFVSSSSLIRANAFHTQFTLPSHSRRVQNGRRIHFFPPHSELSAKGDRDSTELINSTG